VVTVDNDAGTYRSCRRKRRQIYAGVSNELDQLDVVTAERNKI